jgi:hypothetical protein
VVGGPEEPPSKPRREKQRSERDYRHRCGGLVGPADTRHAHSRIFIPLRSGVGAPRVDRQVVNSLVACRCRCSIPIEVRARGKARNPAFDLQKVAPHVLLPPVLSDIRHTVRSPATDLHAGSGTTTTRPDLSMSALALTCTHTCSRKRLTGCLIPRD